MSLRWDGGALHVHVARAMGLYGRRSQDPYALCYLIDAAGKTWFQLNNEKTEKNSSYAVNLATLENFVMVKHNQDSMVEPRESSHFEFYVPGQATVILPLRESPLYTEDRIGLKSLDEAGRLHLMEVEGNHLEFTRQWFIDNIINVYLKN